MDMLFCDVSLIK